MRKIFFCTLLCFWGATISFGQIMSENEEILKKYKNKLPDTEIERFTSPEIYQQPAESIDNPKTKTDKKKETFDKLKYSTDDSLTIKKPQLQIFGYDIFEDADLSFIPNIHDLPPDGYTLGPGDNVIVNVWGRVDLELKLTIDREGKIFIPKVGELIASGSTLEQFKQILDNKLSKVYSDYQFSVSYGRLRQISIYVFGEVNKPGAYTMSSLANRLHALYMAGGITKNGSLRQIQLIRNTKIIFQYDLYDLLLKGDNSKSLKLMSGDVVYIPVVGPLTTVSGEVRRPAIYESQGTECVADAIELAGGSTPEAFLESISLDRIGPNDSRILIDLNLVDSVNVHSDNVRLQDGDIITIHSIYDFHENRVYLTGHVKHPGSFGINDTLHISHLINNGEQLKENTYLIRADLFRTNSDGTRTLTPVNLEDILDGNKESDLQLAPFDSLVVYSFKQVARTKYVRISGEVKNPDEYILYKGMKLSDLIFLAGNLTKQAYNVQCEVARSNPGHETDIITVNLEDILANRKPESDIVLQEDDYVFIRQIPDWRPVQTVQLEGEVLFPGKYAIRDKDESLSELIKRAGGLTLSAFPQGAIYFRKKIEVDVSRRNIGQIINNTNEVRLDSLGNITSDVQVKYDPSQLNRIIIDLPAIMKNPGSPIDIVLADSDYIFIPNIPSGVQVIGALAANGTISFVKQKKSKYYIAQAGGITPAGDKSELRLVKPNGKVYYGRQARSKKIELGDAIIIPSKIKRKTDWGKILSTTATILGSMATTALVIDRIK